MLKKLSKKIETDGSDYIGGVQELTFMPGESQLLVLVLIVEDAVYEGVQEFYAKLTTTDNGVNIVEPNATAVIYDNDGMYLVIIN